MITRLDYDKVDAWDMDGDGAPGIGLFSNALQVWSLAQERETTIQEAALAFNVCPDLMKEAVDWHPWLYLHIDTIEHEGE